MSRLIVSSIETQNIKFDSDTTAFTIGSDGVLSGTGAPAMVLLNTTTVSSGTTNVDIEQFSSTYSAYKIIGYNIVKDPVHVHDLQATILHLFGINHEKMTYKYQGRRFRLTDVHGEIKHDILT